MSRYLGMNSTDGRAIEDIAHLRQSVSDILLTPQGSRLARRTYGSLLFELIDQPQNPALRLQVMSAVYTALTRWEPRLTLSSKPPDSPFHSLSIQRHKMAVIDLSQLPAPQIVEVPEFETLFAERKAALIALYPTDQQDAITRTLTLESEPMTKLLQESVYCELLLRQRLNEAAQAVMVAYSLSSDLDQLAANYNVQRLTITPADNTTTPPTAAVMETDDDLRLRIPAAFEGLSVAGPTAAYEFHAKSTDGRVADASATSPNPAEVVVTILSREGDGSADSEL